MDKIFISNDPLRELGPGINSHHWLLTMFCGLFLTLGVLHIPVLIEFTNSNFFDSDKYSWIVRSSLGNMGYSQT